MYDINLIVDSAFDFDDFVFDLKLRYLILRLKRKHIESEIKEIKEIKERLKKYPKDVQHHVNIRIELLEDIRKKHH